MTDTKPAREDTLKNRLDLGFKRHFEKWLRHWAMLQLERLQGERLNYAVVHGIDVTKMEKNGRIYGIQPSSFYVGHSVSEPPDFVPDRWRASDRFKPDDGITLCLGPYYFETSGGREIRPARALPFL